MGSYNISYKMCGKYSAVIYPVSYLNPIDELSMISKELRNKIPCNSYILFDLLLSNGDNFNRFAEAFYDGNELKDSSINITQISGEQLHGLNMYYHGRTKDLNNSVLTPRERFKYATMK